MTDSDDMLLELLQPHFPNGANPPPPELTNSYLARLTSLPLSAIRTTEPSSLAATSHSIDISLQSLASRNHKAIITSSHHLSSLSSSVSALSDSLQDLKSALPDLDVSLEEFTSTYARDTSTHLQVRAQNQLLNANLERLLDILHLPSLLQSLIASANYPTALDTLAHVRRLRGLYPESPTIGSVHTACEALQKSLTANLISTLRGPLKLPVAMKTVGFLRRTLGGGDERAIRGVFLVCRHAYLHSLLEALAPLKELAEEERLGRSRAGGLQTERYLKRWLEVFREQSFGIVSMYRSIFPGAVPVGGTTSGTETPTPPTPTLPPQRPGHSRSSSSLSNVMADDDPDSGSPPDPVAGFSEHLVGLLVGVLRTYLPVVEERGVRESLLTQVLYASGSLGRLGGEFAGVLAGVKGVFGIGVEGEEAKEREREFVGVVARQKVLAGRLEAMAAGRSG